MQPGDHRQLANRFTQAYELHADELYRYCRGKTNSKEEGEDLMQETFLRTWLYLSTGHSVDDLRTFLFRVAKNLLIDDSRKKKDMSLDILQDQGFDPSHETVENTQQSIDIDHVLLSVERKEEHRLLIMRYVHGMRPVDIASQTGIAANTVAVRLHRAIRKLNQKFD